MGKFEKILIASDYDGTLNNDEGHILPEVRSAISRFTSGGGYFTVCTGRTYQGFSSCDVSILNAPVLLTNGSMAYDYAKGEIAFINGIGEEGCGLVRAVRDAFPGVSIEMYPFNKTFAVNLTPQTRRHFTSQGIPFKTVEDPAETVFPWAKVMIGCDSPETSLCVQEFLKNNFDDPSFLPTSGTFIEVMKRGADKGTGLYALADFLGVPRSRCFAVGDGYNDLEMLRAAAAGFVPENGSPEALAAATHIVRSNNSGAVANVIEIIEEMTDGGLL